MCRDMKDSGVQWIGYIPKAWNITKIKMLSDIYTGTSISDDLKDRYTVKENAIPYISTKDLDISSKSIDYDNGLFIPNGEKGFRLAEKDSTLLCIEGGSAGKKVAFTDRDVNFVNKLCCIKSKDYNNKFIYYYINSSAFTEQFNLNLSGLIGGVSINLLKQIIIVVPTVYEQQKISNYLDKKVSQIDYIISKQKSLIEKYKAYKQSLITETVTKGLNKNAPMKDSGIEWIGEIPMHWNVLKIKNVLENKSIKNNKDEQVLSLYRDYGVIPKDSRNDNYNVTSEDTSGYKLVEEGDFVINKMKAWQGSMAISRYRGIISPAYYICKFKKTNVNKEYFNYLLRNQIYLPEFRRLSTGMRIGQWDLSFDDFKQLPYFQVPDNEEREIVEYLNKKCNKIDLSITKKEQLIERLESYKKSLIYECVTGKREVN